MFGRSSLPFGDATETSPSDDAGGDEVDDEQPTAATADDRFDPPDAFVPESLPEAGDWLSSGDATVLTGGAHVGVRAVVRDIFEARGVRDATFGYVLTKLERDRDHPEAGLRYARDGRTLRVEFVPTTAFCPQGGSLALAASRALNAECERHGFEAVRVRIADDYHSSEAVNRRLREQADHPHDEQDGASRDGGRSGVGGGDRS
ncbi:hypothetical protein [Halobaculum marinum]|uniref:DUF7998 domain-containing protein n=1 Tax=Halobaculum marinum TaxID=3031996 RepID=A0ABD5X7F0_9EURY|nr:hypothetical protein [Halobaculum sp. DT55]